MKLTPPCLIQVRPAEVGRAGEAGVAGPEACPGYRPSAAGIGHCRLDLRRASGATVLVCLLGF